MKGREVDHREILSRIQGRRDLGLRIEGSIAPELENTIPDVNNLLGEIGMVFEHLFAQGLEQTRISDAVKNDASEMVNAANQTKTLASQVSESMKEMINAVNEIVTKIGESSRKDASEQGADSLVKTDSSLESVKKLSARISSWAETNRALSQAAKEMSSVMVIIEDLADDTNLLALNAAIQAAQAGEKGRGFEVVAKEMKRLAIKTAQHIDEIEDTLRLMKNKADDSISNMQDTLSVVQESIRKAEATDTWIRQIVSKASGIAGEVSLRMDSVSTQSNSAREIAMRMETSGESVAESAMDIFSQLCALKLNDVDRAMEGFLVAIAQEFQEKLAADIDSGRVTTDDLFDEKYIDGNGGRQRNKATEYFSRAILPRLKEWSSSNPRIIYVVVMDRNGFMPTHVNPVRAGVIMKDTVSQRGATTKKIIGQAFRRPIQAGGELVVDISCPIAVMNQHWGCLRIGYLPLVSSL
ncbi:MAG TPA: methyl-accepting chemotaxis protein [Thermodesulfovibrionales bacterium]|nr:methyl-accepting chemotaxis protein [Thermodesulfovibrionales bacterium]